MNFADKAIVEFLDFDPSAAPGDQVTNLHTEGLPQKVLNQWQKLLDAREQRTAAGAKVAELKNNKRT